jgi:hypothetical protein
MINIQGSQQNMIIVTGDMVAFHPLLTPWVWHKELIAFYNSASIICYASIEAYMQGPALVLVPNSGSQSKGGRFN